MSETAQFMHRITSYCVDFIRIPYVQRLDDPVVGGMPRRARRYLICTSLTSKRCTVRVRNVIYSKRGLVLLLLMMTIFCVEC